MFASIAIPRRDGTDERWTGHVARVPSIDVLVDTLWPLIVYGGGVGTLIALVAYVVGLALFRAGRSTQWTAALIALGLGWFLGTQLTLAIGRLQARPTVDATLGATTPLLIGLVTSIVLGASRRRRLAGWFVVGMAAPWTLLFGAYVVELQQGEDLAPFTTVAGFLVGAVPLAIGLVLALLSERPPDPDPFAPAGRPGSRRPGSLTAGLMRRARYGIVGPGFVMSLVVTSAVTLFGHELPIVVQVVLIAVGVLLATQLELVTIPSDARRASDAYHWIGRSAIARLERVSGRPMPRSRPAMERWLAEPETPMDISFRPELLAYIGRADEARAVLARVPAETPVERFHRATSAWELDWRAAREPEPVDFPALIAAIGPEGEPDRVLAEGLDAWRRSEVALAALDPGWIAALVGFQRRLGDRARPVAMKQRQRVLMVNAGMAAVLFLVSVTMR